MTIRYDRAGDILVVDLGDLRESLGAVEVGPGAYVDVADDGKVLAIEVLGASAKYPRELLEAIATRYDEPIPLVEAALIANTSADALYRAIKRGRLTGELRGRDWFVTEEALEAYLRSRKHAGPKSRVGSARAAKSG